jgi:hypothetical protein
MRRRSISSALLVDQLDGRARAGGLLRCLFGVDMTGMLFYERPNNKHNRVQHPINMMEDAELALERDRYFHSKHILQVSKGKAAP